MCLKLRHGCIPPFIRCEIRSCLPDMKERFPRLCSAPTAKDSASYDGTARGDDVRKEPLERRKGKLEKLLVSSGGWGAALRGAYGRRGTDPSSNMLAS